MAVVNAKDVRKPDGPGHPSATAAGSRCLKSASTVYPRLFGPGLKNQGSTATLNLKSTQNSDLGEGGFLAPGRAMHFKPNPDVSSVDVGAGKSTVIESLRYVLNLEPIGEDALKAHTGMMRHVIRNGTKITLRLRVCRPAEREYMIERTVPNPAIVREENGQISKLSPRDILPSVDIYGQHEISELAKSPGKRTVLIDRFVAHDESLNRQKRSLIRNLRQTRKAIVDARAEIEQIDEQLAKLPGLEETLERYKEAGLENRLRERSLLVREERLLDSIPERISTLRECLDTLRQELPIDRAFLSEKALEKLPGKEILASADPVLESLSLGIEAAATLIENALEQADKGMRRVRSSWSVRKGEVESEYQKILRELQKSAVDGAEFIRLRREIEALRPLRDRRAMLERFEEDHSEQRRALLAEWEEVKAKEFRLLDREAKRVSTRLRGRVKVSVTAADNRESLFEVLKDETGGRLSEAMDISGAQNSHGVSSSVAGWLRGAFNGAYCPRQTAHAVTGQATLENLVGLKSM